ncbi:MAG: hypothetical protein V3T17_14510 [Pseudomonadales bacterium]
MAKHNSKTSADKTQQPWVKLIDEYTEVISLNSFFYDAVESLYSEQELAPTNKIDSHHGLIILIGLSQGA